MARAAASSNGYWGEDSARATGRPIAMSPLAALGKSHPAHLEDDPQTHVTQQRQPFDAAAHRSGGGHAADPAGMAQRDAPDERPGRWVDSPASRRS